MPLSQGDSPKEDRFHLGWQYVFSLLAIVGRPCVEEKGDDKRVRSVLCKCGMSCPLRLRVRINRKYGRAQHSTMKNAIVCSTLKGGRGVLHTCAWSQRVHYFCPFPNISNDLF